jgi:hypothetical protein
MDGFDATLGCYIKYAHGFKRPLNGMTVEHGDVTLSWIAAKGVCGKLMSY